MARSPDNGMDRRRVLGFRIHAQQLDREPGSARPADTAVLDLGVQDTGPDGSGWALTIRGVDPPATVRKAEPAEKPDRTLALLWTLRGAPTLYRRRDLPQVARAVEPFSEADAGRRMHDIARRLREAGIGYVEALDRVADAMRAVVTGPMTKGEVSTRLTPMLDAPVVHYCRRCGVDHTDDMLFRLAAVRAGLELVPGTSPPVMQPAGFQPATRPSARHDVVRGYLHLLGPATPGHVAAFLDAPVADVRAHWPEDAVEVRVDGEKRWLLASDRDAVDAPASPVVRLLGPFDPFLQAQDRPLLVQDAARRKLVWPVLGRPGVVLAGGDLAGLWRPRQVGGALTVRVEWWAKAGAALRAAAGREAERLAAYRGVRLAGVDHA